MDNDEKKIPEGEEPVEEAENEDIESSEEEESSSGIGTMNFSREGAQSEDAMFGHEAAVSGIIPGLIDRDVASEVKTAFLDYSMSVIVSRAIPDVRDGFKPVQRRIIYGMNESGMQPNKPYKKCARIVGDVMGKYHPHGDAALYGTLVRLAQPFSLRYPLVDGHGNFGDIDGDEAAAMRYTEARMNKLSLELVRDINCDTVNFVANYDGTEVEPEVLPCRFPNLLVNGSQGIAVGMATNMAPHNMSEAIDAVVAVARNPELTPLEIMQNYLPGPDFPSGGIILGRKGILDAYTTGTGTITIRSKYHVEEMDNGKSRIIVTEIPYQVNKARLVERIAELVKAKRGDISRINVYGQEKEPATYRLAKMNLALRGISHNLGDEADSSFTHDLHRGIYFDYIMANPPFNLKGWYDENLKNDYRWADYTTPPESNANTAWILHILSHLRANKGVAGFLLANGALGDSDTVEIRKKLIQNDKVEAIIILPRELFITTDISVTLWILNQNKKGGDYHGRALRNREHEILFMDLRTWTENPVKNESKKKVRLTTEQIERAAEIYHSWQGEGIDGTDYAVPELYRSVGTEEIKQNGWSLIPSKYIEFIDHDLEIDFPAEMRRIQQEMRDVLAKEKESQKMLEEAFRGIGYGIE